MYLPFLAGRLDSHQRGVLEGDFSSAMSLYHGYDLLIQHGMRPFFNFMQKITGENSNANSPGGSASSPGATNVNRRLRYELSRIPIWSDIQATLREKFIGDMNHSRLNNSRPNLLLSQFGSAYSSQKEDLPLGHPKLEKLRDTVLAHFNAKKDMESTRVMIFSQYRDSVKEITAMLHLYKPLVKVMEFVGQSGTNGKKGTYSIHNRLLCFFEFTN